MGERSSCGAVSQLLGLKMQSAAPWDKILPVLSVKVLHGFHLDKPNRDAAWERFVDLYAPLIYHRGRKQGLDATDASELMQEVMAILVRKLPEFEYDPTKRFRGWLRTVTVNRARDFQRRESVRPTTGAEDTIERTVVTNVADLFDEAEFRSLLVKRTLELMRAEFRKQTRSRSRSRSTDSRYHSDHSPKPTTYTPSSRFVTM